MTDTAPLSPFEAAARAIGAMPSDIPGLWWAPWGSEITSGQLLDIASRRSSSTAPGDLVRQWSVAK